MREQFGKRLYMHCAKNPSFILYSTDYLYNICDNCGYEPNEHNVFPHNCKNGITVGYKCGNSRKQWLKDINQLDALYEKRMIFVKDFVFEGKAEWHHITHNPMHCQSVHSVYT